MTEQEMKPDTEIQELADEMSDEALDRVDLVKFSCEACGGKFVER
jgi:hypothetical protein